MDFGLLLVITLFTTGLQWLMNRDERSQAKEDTLDIQHDAQEENARQAQISRDWQERFWKENQSPEALVNQYRGLGASESAALMSALGISPSVASGATASTGSASGLGAGVSSISELLNSLTGGFKNFMEGEKVHEETKWIGPVNDASIKKTLGDLEIHWKEFGLHQREFDEIAVPLAKNTINKTEQEIKESQAKIRELNQQVSLMQQQVKESQQNIVESQARTDLLGEQAVTEQYKQANLQANTELQGSQKIGQDIQNQLDAIALSMSQELGIDVRLSFDKNLLYAYGKTVDSFKLSWNDFSKSLEKTYDSIVSGMDYQSISRYMLNKVESYFCNPFYPHYNVFKHSYKDFKPSQSYQNWLRKRGNRFKQAEDWINHNTRYGM